MNVTITDTDGTVYAHHELVGDEPEALANAIAEATLHAEGKVHELLKDIADAAEAFGDGQWRWWE